MICKNQNFIYTIKTQIILMICIFILIPHIAIAKHSDAKDSKDHALVPRISNFYIDRFRMYNDDYETFKTDGGRTRINGRKFYIDYRIQPNTISPGKRGILSDYHSLLSKKGAATLLKGPYYNVYKITNNSTETWIKVDPGVYDGKRYEVTIVEKEGLSQTINTKSPAGLPGTVFFKQLSVIQSSGKSLDIQKKSAMKGPKKFIYNQTQKIGIKTLVKNESGETKNNIRVNFIIDGKVTDTTLIESLKPGEVREAEGQYDIPDVGTHEMEVTLVEEETQKVIATIDGELLGESEASDVTGLVYPDFQIRDIAYYVNSERVAVELQNNGHQVNKIVRLKAWYIDPYGPYSKKYQADIPISLGPGERKWIDFMTNFSWPDPLNIPKLTFTIEIDSDKKVTETDEENNYFQKDVCVPCGVHIDELSSYSLTATGDNTSLFIYGRFGHRRASKQVGLVEKDSGRVYLLDINDYLRYPQYWNDEHLEIYLSGIPYGTYNVVIYCSDPLDQSNRAFTSNYSGDFKRKRHKYKKDLGDLIEESMAGGDMNSKSLEDRLGDALSLDSPPGAEGNPVSMWVDQTANGFILNTISKDYQQFEKIIFEVWAVKPPIRLRHLDIPITSNEQLGRVDGLDEAIFEFKARFIYRGGKELSKSIVFKPQ